MLLLINDTEIFHKRKTNVSLKIGEQGSVNLARIHSKLMTHMNNNNKKP